jgi:hypothetical protein
VNLSLEDSVLSPQDLKATILEVRRYAKWFAQSAIKMRLAESNLEQQPVISPTAARLINEWAEQNPLSQKSLDALIANLEQLEATLPRITITLAGVAPASLKNTLVTWCRENIAPNILVDFRFNSTILGGMVVKYGSHVYDWSFRRQILAARGNFPEALRRV